MESVSVDLGRAAMPTWIASATDKHALSGATIKEAALFEWIERAANASFLQKNVPGSRTVLRDLEAPIQILGQIETPFFLSFLATYIELSPF